MSPSHLAFWAALAVAALAVGPARAAEPGSDNDARAKRFIAAYEAAIRPLEIEVNRRWWTANLSGNDDDYKAKQQAETRLDLQLSDPKTFAELKAIKEGRIADRLLRRQIDVLYLQYLAKQVDPELLEQMLAKSNAVEKAFNVHRARVDGKELNDNEIREVLRHSNDSARLRAVWEASKGVGRVVEAELKQLVALRNRSARQLGFQDYHVMQLHLGEQSQTQVLKLFDELDALTREPFQAAKAELDAALAKRYGVAAAQLRPWHYHDPFFQDSPAVFGENADAVYASIDIVKTCRRFYDGIALPADDVLARSDLFEKKGKNPHAFSTDIDREGDVRVLANIVPDKQWLATMLHELGHAVYSKNLPRGKTGTGSGESLESRGGSPGSKVPVPVFSHLPYALRIESHPLTTEGVAMMFERFAENADWLTAMGVKVPNPKDFNATAAKLRRNQLLIFSRWCQVMFRFEKELYARPDQDLNRLWWDLVEKYQQLKRPEGRDQPDYAAKIHVVNYPVYYHNYMLGELFAAQLHATIVRDVLGEADPAKAVYAGRAAVGRFMKERVFGPGRTLDWNGLTRYATGEDLSAKAFAAELKNR